MREILFRGKCGNKWHYGDLYTQSNTPQIIAYNKKYDKIDSAFVDPETMGQFTGLRDCKRTEEYPEGQMIFEGDVVLCDRHINDEFDKKTFFVREIYPISGLIGESLSGNEICGDDWEFAEVIGNIHDNPELLKEGGEE